MSKEAEVQALKIYSEMELFINLLDDIAADKILKMFNETVPGWSKNPPIQKKKEYIHKIFKKQTAQTSKRKSDPFILALKGLKDESFEGLTEVEFFEKIGDSEGVPPYKKFANAILYHPKGVKKRILQYTEKYEENVDLFNEKRKFENDAELRTYLNEKLIVNSKENVISLFESILNCKTEEEKNTLNEVVKIVKSLSLIEFYEKQSILRNNFPEDLLYFSYGLTHPQEDIGILINIAVNTLIKDMRDKEKLSNKVKSAEIKIDEIELELQRQLDKTEEIKKLRKDLKNTRDEVKQNKTKAEELQKLYQQTVDNINQHKVTYDETIRALKNEKERSERAYKKQLLDKDGLLNQYEELWLDSNQLYRSEFLVIYTMRTNLFKVVFPEIQAIEVVDWHIKKIRGEIKKIYIQRDMLSSPKLNEIISDAKSIGIQVETFNVRSPKDLLEKLAYFKQKEREQ